MATPTDDRPELLTVIAYMKDAPGKEEELRKELANLVGPTSQEKGFVNYDLHVAEDDPGKFFLYENWESAADLDTHLGAPHLVRFAAMLGDLLDESGLSINRVHRIA